MQTAFQTETETPPTDAREAALAGFVFSGGKHKRVHPDLRGKINLRQAEKQADGTFYIPDVDCFRPNQAKGETGEYTAEDCRDAMKNTTRMIEAGGQMPSITLEHPSPLAKANGVASKSWGNAVNFRESPRGDGWVRCDFIKVHPQVVEDWKKGHYTGMSSGIVSDKKEQRDENGNIMRDEKGNPLFEPANLRFGHIALLGGESQAISDLPMTQIFAACAESELVCFCTEEIISAKTFQVDKISPNTGNTQTSFQFSYMTIDTLTAELTAAFSAGDTEKVNKVRKQIDGLCVANFGAEEVESLNSNNEGDGEDLIPDLEMEEEPVSAGSDLELPNADEDFDAYSAEEDRFSALESEVNRLRSVEAGYKAKRLEDMFSAEVDSLISKGHVISKESAMDMFSALLPNPEAMATYRSSLYKTPIARASARGGHFSAASSGDIGAIGQFGVETGDEFSAGIAEFARAGITVTAADLKKAEACFVKTR